MALRKVVERHAKQDAISIARAGKKEYFTRASALGRESRKHTGSGSMWWESPPYSSLVNVNNGSYLACGEQITWRHEEDKMHVHNSLLP